MAMMMMTQAGVQKWGMVKERQTRPRNIPCKRMITGGHQPHQTLARHHILAQVPHILTQVQEQYQADHHILAKPRNDAGWTITSLPKHRSNARTGNPRTGKATHTSWRQNP
jgi:hypothetical protein